MRFNICKKNVILVSDGSGFVLISSVLVMFFLSILLGAVMIRTDMQIKETDHLRAVQEAFYGAESGIDRAIFELRRTPSWLPGVNGQPTVEDVSLDITDGEDTRTVGSYSVVVADAGKLNGWDTRWIKSVGQDSQRKVTRTIFARVLVESPTRFMVSTMGDLRPQSGNTFDAAIFGKNIYFEVLEASSDPNIHVKGDVFYSDKVYGDKNPYVLFDAGVQERKTPPITFAGVDIKRYKELAANLEGDGKAVSLSGDATIDLDNIDNLSADGDPNFAPMLVYAEGDVYIHGTYDSSLLVVAGGDIYIDGNIIAQDPPAGSLRPQIGLLAKQDAIIPSDVSTGSGNLSIEAFILAAGSNGSDGVFKAEASSNRRGTLNFTGAISARGGDARTAVDLNVYEIRNYVYNSELNQNRQIPFTPFIVNIIHWEEASPSAVFPPADS